MAKTTTPRRPTETSATKASSTAKATSAAGKDKGKTGAKPTAAPRSPPRKVATGPRSSSGSSTANETAMDLLMKLLESPLVADLLAVGATAALGAITASRFSRRDGDGRKSGHAVKSAGKAAAAAIGLRLKEEFDAIRGAAEASQPSGA